jgi:hypothetical protein
MGNEKNLTESIESLRERGMNIQPILEVMDLMSAYRTWFVKNNIPHIATDLLKAVELTFKEQEIRSIASDMVKHSNE